MANTYLTSGTRFKPFSFQEMLQPVQIYTEAYDTLENELANLDVLADDVGSKLTSPEDAALQKTYNTYKEDLTKALDTLYKEGLTPESKKKLSNLKARFTKDLLPINEAYKAYQEDKAYLNKLSIEHPEMLVQGAGNSISAYMNGNRPQMLSVNRDDLMNQALTIAKTQAGRTYRQSGWVPTAGGRFLERNTEIGLNDVEFNNALAVAMSGRTDFTPEELGITPEEFNHLMTNAALIQNSIDDIIASPDFNSLTDANKQKAMNSIIKGVRAGFQYDRKVETENDPMFAYNLKAAEDALKGKQTKAGLIGSAPFLTPENTLLNYRDKYQNVTGHIHDTYNYLFSEDGKLKTPQAIEQEERLWESNMKQSGQGVGTYMPRAGMFNLSKEGSNSPISQYKDIQQAMIDLGLDPNTATKAEFEERLRAADVAGRNRGRIISDDKGFSTVQSYIETALINAKTVEEIEGLGEAEGDNLNRRYRTNAKVKYEDLLDKDNKLNILSVNMDYQTGQRTFTVKTKKGVREFLMPYSSTFKAGDQAQLESMATEIDGLNRGYVFSLDKDGNTNKKEVKANKVYQFPDGFVGTPKARVDYLIQEMNIIFGDSVNYFGAQNIGG